MRPPRFLAALLLVTALFPLAVSAKGFSPAGSSHGGGGFSSSRPSAPNSRPQSGTFRPIAPPASTAAQRAGERAAHTTIVHNRTTVVGGGGGYSGGGSSSWFLPALIGYYAGGGCNRDRNQGGQ